MALSVMKKLTFMNANYFESWVIDATFWGKISLLEKLSGLLSLTFSLHIFQSGCCCGGVVMIRRSRDETRDERSDQSLQTTTLQLDLSQATSC